MTPTKAAEDVLVERLRRYSEYVERQLGALTPPDAIDLRVGPRMCVDAMIEAADAITTLLERERRLLDLVREADETAWPEAVILLSHSDPKRTTLAKKRLMAWRVKARAALTQPNPDREV